MSNVLAPSVPVMSPLATCTPSVGSVADVSVAFTATVVRRPVMPPVTGFASFGSPSHVLPSGRVHTPSSFRSSRCPSNVQLAISSPLIASSSRPCLAWMSFSVAVASVSYTGLAASAALDSRPRVVDVYASSDSSEPRMALAVS